MYLLQFLSNVFVFVVLFVLETAESVVIVVLYILSCLFRVRLHFQALRLLYGLLVASAESLPVLPSLQIAFPRLGLAGRDWLGYWFAVELNGFGGLPSWHGRLPVALFVPCWFAVGVNCVDGVVPLLVAGAFFAAGALLIGLLVLVAADLHLLLSRPSTT